MLIMIHVSNYKPEKKGLAVCMSGLTVGLR